MQDMLYEFIKPELLSLIPVLYLFGTGLKKSQVANKHIPWMLGVASVVLCLMFIAAMSDINGWQEVLMAVFSGITQGVLCAGASVYVNQIVKQSGKSK